MPSPYIHTQKAPLCLLLYLATALMFTLALLTRSEAPHVTIILGVSGVLMAVLSASFHHLTVADMGDRLAIRFGPLPLFRRSVRYEEIESVAVSRTTILDGWGIHYSLRRGWVWNLWGRGCVEVKLRKGKLWIGTDDAAGLAEFLKERTAGRKAEA